MVECDAHGDRGMTAEQGGECVQASRVADREPQLVMGLAEYRIVQLGVFPVRAEALAHFAANAPGLPTRFFRPGLHEPSDTVTVNAEPQGCRQATRRVDLEFRLGRLAETDEEVLDRREPPGPCLRFAVRHLPNVL